MRRRPALRSTTAGAGLALVGTLLAACGTPSTAAAPTVPLSSVTAYQAIPQQPLGPATESVIEATGGTWSYARPPAGRVTLLYFGYTDCPDVCPLTMSDLAVAVRHLPGDLRDKVWVQFVSTDPHRDTTARLRRWVDSYSPTFHGGRAPIGSVITAARTYGISIKRPRITHGDYQVTHGADVLVLDPHGGEVGFFTELAGWHAYAKALPTLIERYA